MRVISLLKSVPPRNVDSITVPASGGSSLTYTLTYHVQPPGNYYGELASISSPSGTTIAYTYQDNSKSDGNPFALLSNPVLTKSVTSRSTDDQQNVQQTENWAYNILPLNGQTIVTSPDGGTQTFSYNSPALPWDSLAGLIYKIQQPNNDLIERRWAGNRPFIAGISPPGQINPYVRTEYRTVASAPGSPVKTAVRDFRYDKNGNMLQVDEYDWVNYSASNATSGFLPASTFKRRSTVTTITAGAATATAGTGTESVSDDPHAYWNPASPALRALPASKAIYDGFGALKSGTSFPQYDVHGNPLQEARWDSVKNADVITALEYDGSGNLTKITDPSLNVTCLAYGASVGGLTGVYVTQKTEACGSGVARSTSFAYDSYSGLVTTRTDVSNGTSTQFVYDALGRPTLVTEAGLRSTITQYDDANLAVTVWRDLMSLYDGKLMTISHYDSLGRLRLVRQTDDGGATLNVTNESGGVKVQRRYKTSSGNQYELVSTPYRAATSSQEKDPSTQADLPTMGWTLTKRDKNGRVSTVQHFRGTALPSPWGANSTQTGTVQTTYDAENTTVTDEDSRSRTHTVDALGRLVQVTENAGTTSYTYDALDNVTGLRQPGGSARCYGYDPLQQGAANNSHRCFSYDSLGRLSSANQPESGITSYTYFDNSNLKTRSDERPVTVTYSYDSLSRMTGKTYSDYASANPTPWVTYSYDDASVSQSRGRLTSVYSNASSYNVTSYDALGRVTGSRQTTSGQAYPFTYAYNLADEPTVVGYPSGRSISTTYSGAGRPLSVAGSKNSVNTTYASGAAYAAHGGLQQVSAGTAGVVQTMGYNSRLQVESAAASKNGSTLYSVVNGYASTSNNGNIQSQTITRPGAAPVTQTFSYDLSNRLLSASEPGGWTQNYAYDARGNRAVIIGSSMLISNQTPQTANSSSVPFDDRNRWIGTGYDPAGNQTGVDVYSRTYDAESRLISVVKSPGGTTVGYTYDGDGQRVTRTTSSGTTVYVYDVLGRLAAEYGLASGSSATLYPMTDHLGSTRFVTDGAGNTVSCHDYLPFGEEVPTAWGGRTSITCYNQQDGLTQRFTGQLRDSETALDWFNARYMSSGPRKIYEPGCTFRRPIRRQSTELEPLQLWSE